MKLSVVIPAHNEEDCIKDVILGIINALKSEAIPYQLVVVNDNSNDRTPELLADLADQYTNIRVIHKQPPACFGGAIRDGLANITGDAVVIAMGDASDDPADICRYYWKLKEGYDCVFGSRFIRGSVVRDYPPLKRVINRLANNFVRLLFLVRHNDITNAFKAYRTEVIQAISPIQATHFNITVELPLKAIARGFSYATIPISWYGRAAGVSKLKIREMSRKYLFTVLYVWLEKHLLSDEYPTRFVKKA